jgi:hypothetical protein
MITATATGADGKRILLLGLTRTNIDLLIAGQPIDVDAVTHPGFPSDLRIMILFGETERAIAESLQDLIDPEHTKVVAVPRDHPTRSS